MGPDFVPRSILSAVLLALLATALLTLSACGGETGNKFVGHYAKVRGDGWPCFEVRESLILGGEDGYPVDDFDIDGNEISFGNGITNVKLVFEEGGRVTSVGKILAFGIGSADYKKVSVDDPGFSRCRALAVPGN